jgi:hypothetical protein
MPKKHHPELLESAALLVGVGADLPATVSDAKRMRDLLLHDRSRSYPTNRLKLLTESQATVAEITSNLRAIGNSSIKRRYRTFIFYFSGHGGRNSSRSSASECFLVPYGYDTQSHATTSLPGKLLRALLERIVCDRMVAIFDCCHAGGIKSGVTLRNAPLPSELLKTWNRPGAVVLLASSHEDEYSYVEGGNSIFTATLLDGIQKHRRYRIFDLILFLFEEVARRSKRPATPICYPRIWNRNEFPALRAARPQPQTETLERTPTTAPRYGSATQNATNKTYSA